MNKASLTAIARRFSFVRETEGPNAGFWVEWFLRFTGNVASESWCAAFISRVEDIAYKGKSPAIKSASTQLKLAQARKNGWVVKTPQVDDEFFYINEAGLPHHVGIVTGVSPLTGIAGNTSEDGRSSNGTGVYEHAISNADVVFVRLP